ncbi:hypothetical protein QBC38DRAFT_492304 [Podospora fimiseda]|uniref:Uncharacterized protein n=1 Tax=Podospora fimiseda TaxID=252190 RepID=A0AAN6YRW5_9PEZI|nr:hypothetical protein QBC38DRAFT_492304 [Podospora fimiseda]
MVPRLLQKFAQSLQDLPPELQEIFSRIQANLTHTTFDHDGCRERIEGLFNQGILSNQSTTVLDFMFPLNATGGHRMGHDDMVVAFPACQAVCGVRGWYIDKGPRLMVWVLPILLLVSNIELSPIDKRRLVTIAQSGGDPVDCTWSLLAKLDSRKRIYGIAQDYLDERIDRRDLIGRPWNILVDRARVVATVLSGLEDIFSAELERDFDSVQVLRQFMEDFGASSTDREIQNLWKKTALDLVDSRTDDILRAILALFVYVLGLCSAFIADIGGSSQTIPGGIIGVSLSLSFLIPLVILSNGVGVYTSRRRPLEIMICFVHNVNQHLQPQHRLHPRLCGEPWEQYFNRLYWNGGVDTFRPWKTHGPGLARNLVHPLIAALPVTAGFVGAFIILSNAAEQGFSCRHIVLVTMYVAWVLSAIFSNGGYRCLEALRFGRPNNRRGAHWYICLVKDTCLASASLVFIFFSAAGYFNSCTCWSRKLFVGWEKATVFLPINDVYRLNYRGLFPGTVAGVIIFQLAFSFGMLWWFGDGFRVLRWSEKKRQMVWEEVMGEQGFQRDMFLRVRGTREEREEERTARLGAVRNTGSFELSASIPQVYA